MDRRAEATSHRGEIWETIWSFVGYGFLSVCLGGLVSITTYPVGEFLVISFLSLTVYRTVSSHCSSLLFSDTELHVFGSLPISASTHFVAKISGSIAYASLVCSALITPSFFVILLERGFFAGLRWIVGVAFCVVFTCLVAVFLYVVSKRMFRDATSKSRLFRSLFLFGASGIFLALWIVLLLPDFELSKFGESWHLVNNPVLLLFPPYWFICLSLLLDGQFNMTLVSGALLVVFGSVPIYLYFHTKVNTTFLVSLNRTNSRIDEVAKSRNTSSLVKWLRIGSLGYERAAMWNLAFSHLKYDVTFHTSWFAFLPLCVVFVGLIIFNNQEPFDAPLSTSDHAFVLTWLGSVLVFYESVIFDALRISSHAPASWVHTSYTTYSASILVGVFACYAIRLLAGARYDRKYLEADLVG